MSQWASAYAEAALGLSKTIGDLAGPCMFAITMGISRMIFGKYGDKMDLMNLWQAPEFMRILLSSCISVLQSGSRTDRLYCLWIFRWNHVAWYHQYFL